MTVTHDKRRRKSRRSSGSAGPRQAHHRRHRGQCPRAPDHPGRRAARHPDPALLRPPAARPGRRLPPVPGRGRGAAQAARLLHHHGHRRHGRQDPAHLAGRRQGAARRDGAAADQPPAGLPGLRQGRRVPAAEPGAEQRPRPRPASRASSAPSPSRSTISAQVLLDRERCVLCARCTRFSEQIAGDPFIELLERGAQQQVGIATRTTSLRVVLLRQHHPDLPGRRADRRGLPVPGPAVRPGLLAERLRALRLRLRAAHRPPARQGAAAAGRRRPAVNEEWNCDKGRWAFQYATRRPAHHPAGPRRDGELVPASWPEALRARRRGCAAAPGPAGVLVGGRLTVEDAYAYAKFARLALGTNDIDFRARAAQRRGGRLPGRARRRPRPGLGARHYADLEAGPGVLLVGFEPEEESPIVFLRLRKAVRTGKPHGLRDSAAGHARTAQAGGTLLPAAPGTEARVAWRPRRGHPRSGDARRALAARGCCASPARSSWSASGWPASPARSARRCGWPRHRRPAGLGSRAGPASAARSRPARCRACCPAAGRSPTRRPRPGRRPPGACQGELPPLGAATATRSSPRPPTASWRPAGRRRGPGRPARSGRRARRPGPRRLRGQPGDAASAVTELADVVFPVAAVAEKAGTFLDWEGRARTFEPRRSARPPRRRAVRSPTCGC
jgi:NADH-quinone oxidoreductase subunit G